MHAAARASFCTAAPLRQPPPPPWGRCVRRHSDAQVAIRTALHGIAQGEQLRLGHQLREWPHVAGAAELWQRLHAANAEASAIERMLREAVFSIDDERVRPRQSCGRDMPPRAKPSRACLRRRAALLGLPASRAGRIGRLRVVGTMQLREAVGRAEMAGFSSDALDVASAIIDEIAASEEALRAAIGDTDASPADTEQDHRRGTAALEAALARARDLRIVSGECHRSARPSAVSIVRPTGLRRRPGL